MVLSDTTVQGNNLTFPTDAQRNQKVIDQCHKIAKKEKRKQRQTYAKASKELVRPTFNGKHPRRAQKAKKATSKLKTLAGRPVREWKRKRPLLQRSQYQEAFELYQRVIDQQRFDQNKVDAVHGWHGQREGSSNGCIGESSRPDGDRRPNHDHHGDPCFWGQSSWSPNHPTLMGTTGIHRRSRSQRMGGWSRRTRKTSDGKHQEIDSKQTMEKR